MDRTLKNVLLIAFGVRLVLWFAYQPLPMGDTADYLEVARQFREGDWASYDGSRPPLYPLLVGLCGSNHRLIWLVQAVMGVATAACLYRLLVSWGSARAVACLGALIPAVWLNLLVAETVVLTEALTRFLLVLAIWQFQRAWSNLGNWRSWVLAGIAMSLPALSHPIFIYLGPLGALAMLLLPEGRSPLRSRLRPALFLLLAYAVPILGWSAVNWALLGYFAPTTVAGYGLVTYAGFFMDDAGPGYEGIRDIYLKYRALGMDSIETATQTIWLAYDELRRSLGLTYVELSRELSRLSVALILRHPMEYAGYVGEAWLSFWRVPIYWHIDRLKPDMLGKLLALLWYPQKILMYLAVASFAVQSLYVTCSIAVGRLYRLHRGEVILVVSILSASLVQALFCYSQAPRYFLPVQPLLGAAVLLRLTGHWNVLRKNAGPLAETTP